MKSANALTTLDSILISSLFGNQFRQRPDDYCNLQSSAGIDIGQCEIQGRRHAQEDKLGFTLSAVANFHLLSDKDKSLVFHNTYQEIQTKPYCHTASGSTACNTVTWIDPKNNTVNIWNGNLGDSLAIAVFINTENYTVATQLINQLHSPDPDINPEEYKRVVEYTKEHQSPPPSTLYDKYWRLADGLMMTRALGDSWSLQYGLSQIPEIRYIHQSINKHTRIFLVTACDGLIEDKVMTPEYIGNLVAVHIALQEPLHRIAAALTRTAYSRGSSDNISVSLTEITNTPGLFYIYDGHYDAKVSTAASIDFPVIFQNNIKKVLEQKSLPQQDPVIAQQVDTSKLVFKPILDATPEINAIRHDLLRERDKIIEKNLNDQSKLLDDEISTAIELKDWQTVLHILLILKNRSTLSKNTISQIQDHRKSLTDAFIEYVKSAKTEKLDLLNSIFDDKNALGNIFNLPKYKFFFSRTERKHNNQKITGSIFRLREAFKELLDEKNSAEMDDLKEHRPSLKIKK